MNRLILASKLLHLLVLLVFFLPFKECVHTKQAETVHPIPDSVAVADTSPLAIKDSINNQASLTENNNDSIPAVLEPILSACAWTLADKNGNYTGVGAVYSGYINYANESLIINSFVLLFLTTIMIFRKRWRFYKSIVLIEIIGFLFLFGFYGDMWGYWVCVSLWAVMVLFDAFLIYKSKREQL